MKKLPTLYKYNTKNKAQQWEIIVEGNSFYTIEGLVDGKLTISSSTLCESKNVGKSNETTPQEQAFFEAKAKWQKKLDEGYNEVLTTQVKFIKPMLAQKYEDYKKLMFKNRTFIQPKLDGLRCVNGSNKQMSRTGKEYLSTPHLNQSTTLLDGELYSHEYKHDFNTIVSLCRKTKPTKEDIELSSKIIEYWIYDLPNDGRVFSKRFEDVLKLVELNPMFKVVPTYEVFNEEDIEKYHLQFIEEGYEGSIIRMDMGGYENKRSKQLLKKKDWMDEEFTILDIESGKGQLSEIAARLILQLPNGETFNSALNCNHEEMSRIFVNKESIIGRQATVKFFDYTPDGKPRFPKVVVIDRWSFE
jgi:ATP-dependent DNA ligase